jgi:hypothetical protein
MTNLPFLLRIGAISSTVALVMLIIISILILPTELDFPGQEIITGKLDPSSPGFAQYITTFQLIQAFDCVFIIGWFVSWVSVSALVRARNRLLGDVALLLGLIGGPFLDFVEKDHLGRSSSVATGYLSFARLVPRVENRSPLEFLAALYGRRDGCVRNLERKNVRSRREHRNRALYRVGGGGNAHTFTPPIGLWVVRNLVHFEHGTFVAAGYRAGSRRNPSARGIKPPHLHKTVSCSRELYVQKRSSRQNCSSNRG